MVRGLAKSLPGHRIERTEIRRDDVVPTGARGLQRAVKSRLIRAVNRRAKNIIIELDADRVLVVNLGMTGRLLFFRDGRLARTGHPAVRFHLADGARLIFDDVRRFGTVEAHSTAGWRQRADRLGPEPLDADFTANDLAGGLETSRSPLRSWLLDQRRIAGVGNIYANEALFLAGLHPRRSARSLDLEDASALHRGLRKTLLEAVELGGTTLRDYVDSDGRRGRAASNLQVYGREGMPCFRCGSTIERTVFGGRSAFHCPTCQPPAVIA